MKLKILSFALALVFVFCLAAPVAAAATDVSDKGKLLDYPLPGDLAFYGGVYNWIDANVSRYSGGHVDADDIERWLNRQGIVHSGNVTKAFDMSDPCVGDATACCVKITYPGDDGVVEIADCPICNWNVGYVLADAEGKLTIDLNAGIAVKDDPDAKFGITPDDIPILLRGVTLSQSIPSLGSFTMDFESGSGTLNASAVSFPIVGYPAFTLPFTLDYGTGLVTADTSSLNANQKTAAGLAITAIQAVYNGIGNIFNFSVPLNKLTFLNDLDYSFVRTFDVPYSFGYAYKDALVDGTQTVLSPADVKDGSWLKYLDQNVGFDAYINELTLENILPQKARDYLDKNWSGWTQYNDLYDYIWAGAIQSLDYINLDAQLLAVLNRIPEFSIVVDALSALGIDRDDVESNLVSLFKTKLAGEWGDIIKENIGIQAGGSTSFAPGSVNNILLSGVTKDADELTYAEAHSLTVGQTLQTTQTTPPTGCTILSTTYALTSGGGYITLDTASGLATAVRAGTAVVTITSEVEGPCGCATTLTTTVTITVESSPGSTKKNNDTTANNTATDPADPTDPSDPSDSDVVEPTTAPLDDGGDTAVQTDSATSAAPPVAEMPVTGGDSFFLTALFLGMYCLSVGIVLRRRAIRAK